MTNKYPTSNENKERNTQRSQFGFSSWSLLHLVFFSSLCWFASYSFALSPVCFFYPTVSCSSVSCLLNLSVHLSLFRRSPPSLSAFIKHTFSRLRIASSATVNPVTQWQSNYKVVISKDKYSFWYVSTSPKRQRALKHMNSVFVYTEFARISGWAVSVSVLQCDNRPVQTVP